MEKTCFNCKHLGYYAINEISFTGWYKIEKPRKRNGLKNIEPYSCDSWEER